MTFVDVPPVVVVADTVTAPATPAGAVALIDVADTNVTLVPAFAPNFTVVAPDTNPLPVIVTTVPPATGPLTGLRAVTVGAATEAVTVKLVGVCLDAPGLVTRILPDVAPTGTTAEIVVSDTTVKAAATPLNETAVALAKFVPVIVTAAPAAADAGVKLATVGAAANVADTVVATAIATVQVEAVPEQVPPDQPAKPLPSARLGVAVSVTCVAGSNVP